MESMKLSKKSSHEPLWQRLFGTGKWFSCGRNAPCFGALFQALKPGTSGFIQTAQLALFSGTRRTWKEMQARSHPKDRACPGMSQGSALPCEDWKAGYAATMMQGFLWMLLFSSTLAYAVYTPMPWEGPICAVASSLKGQVAVVLSVVATIMIGIMFMYAETGGVVARIGSWLLGMSCALSVVSIITALFPGVAIPGCL